jgi:hypothetical protein
LARVREWKACSRTIVTRMDVVIALLEIARETSLDARDEHLTLAL